MTGKTSDFTIAVLANIVTTSENGCLVHVGAADGSDGYSLGVGNTTFADNGNNLIFEACPNQWTVLGPIGAAGWHHLSVVVEEVTQTAVNSIPNPTKIGHSELNWGSFRLTSTDDLADPFGGMTASLLTENTATTVYHYLDSGAFTNPAVSSTVIASCYAKPNGRRLELDITDSTEANGVYATFDISGGQVALTSTTFGTGFVAGTATIVTDAFATGSGGNGWYRCTISATTTSDSTLHFYCALDQGTGLGGTDDSYTGNGSSGVYVAGPQLIAGTTLTGYFFNPKVYGCVDGVPMVAAAAGYKMLTFACNGFSTRNVDIAKTQAAGFDWYQFNAFGGNPDMAAVVINGDGTLTLTGDPTGPVAEVMTASVTGTGTFVGKAFGGGAYFECEMTYDNAGSSGDGWPAFWAMAVEHLTHMATQQWPGQVANYDHFVEFDFFEFDVSSIYYGGAMHDWSGVYTGSNYPVDALSTVYKPFTDEVDFTKFHKYGALWIPATDSTPGRAEYYFDRVKVGNTVTWSKYHTSDTPRGASPTSVGANLLTGSQTVFTGTPGGVGTYPTGYLVYGGQSNNMSLLAATTVNSISTEVARHRRIGAIGYEGMYLPSFSVGQTDAVTEYEISVWLRRPTGVVAEDCSVDIDARGVNESALLTIASAAQLNGQANDVWVKYSVQLQAWKASTLIAFFSQAGSVGQGWDLALPSIGVATWPYSNWSVMDVQHFPLVMGTGTGWPITIRSVNVWQASTAGNL